MINQELLFYIKDQLRQGIPKEAIWDALIVRGGWNRSDLDEAFSFIVVPEGKPISKIVQTSNTGMKPKTQIPEIKPVIDTLIPESVRATKTKQSIDDPGKYIDQKPIKHSKIRWSIILLIVALLLSLGAIALFGYLNFFNKKTPATVVGEMKTAFSIVKTFSFDLETKTTLPQNNTLISLGKIIGGENNIFPDAPSFSINTHGTVDTTTGQLQTTSSVWSNIIPNFSLSLETIFADSSFYIKTSDLTQFESFLPSFPSGTWLSLDQNDITMHALPISEGLTTLLANSIVNQEQIKKALIDGNLFEITAPMPNDTINNEPVYHYQFSFNKENLKTIIMNLADQIFGSTETTDARDFVLQNIDSLQFSNGEIFIGSNDSLPRQINFSVASNDATGPLYHTTTQVTLKFSNFNQSLSITAPPETTSLPEAIALSLAQKKDTTVRTLIDSVYSKAVSYYSQAKSYTSFCTSDQGLSSLLVTLNDTVSPQTAICTSKGVQYVIAAPLSTGTLYCVDSTGTTTELSQAPVGLGCK